MAKETNLINLYDVFGLVILILVLFTGILTGFNITGYFDPYCNDNDAIEDVFTISISQFEYFACELGIVKGSINLSWFVTFTEARADFPNSFSIIILDHNQYSKFVGGENYGVSNTQMHELQTDTNFAQTSLPRSLHRTVNDIELIEDSYYFIIHWEYRISFGPEEIKEPDHSKYVNFHYSVDLDYIEL